MSKITKLTKRQRDVLRRARDEGHVIQLDFGGGASCAQMFRRLQVEVQYLRWSNAAGDIGYFITDAGRAALAKAEAGQ